jgi:hypothetical protein
LTLQEIAELSDDEKEDVQIKPTDALVIAAKIVVFSIKISGKRIQFLRDLRLRGAFQQPIRAP